ncbi:MAG: hypothetical protein ACRDJV_04535 [Actinomycetota bacterium]
MTDIERELAELGNRISESIRPSPHMAERVFRRARIRRAATAATGALLVAVFGLTSFAAVETFADRTSQEPIGPNPSESPLPTETPSPGVGRDIGLGFPVCDVRPLGGIDFLGDGTDGTAWTATTVTDAGRCDKRENSYLVAVDVTGDGAADASWGPLRYCFFCEPFGATDFDGDGDDELVVLAAGGSTPQYYVFAAETTTDGSVELGPLTVASPGNRAGNLPAGKPLRMWAGGDEGFSATVACDGYPEDPVLIVAWSDHPVEGPGSETTEVHITRVVLRDGAFHVVDTLNAEQPTPFGPRSWESLPDVFSRRGRECGLRFNLF